MTNKSIGLSLTEQVYSHLKDSGLKPNIAESFRKLYSHVELKTPCSNYLLDKFERLGFYDRKENLITNPEDDIGLVMQAMVFAGLLEAKCPDGKIRSLSKYKEQKILSKLLVTKKEADMIRKRQKVQTK